MIFRFLMAKPNFCRSFFHRFPDVQWFALFFKNSFYLLCQIEVDSEEGEEADVNLPIDPPGVR